MSGYELLQKMELIDTAHVEEAEQTPIKNKRWAGWTALAACLCLVIGVMGWTFQKTRGPTPPVTVQDPISPSLPDIYLNPNLPQFLEKSEPALMISRAISEDELGSLFPGLTEQYSCDGTVRFLATDGILYDLSLTCTDPQTGSKFSVAVYGDPEGSWMQAPSHAVPSEVCGVSVTGGYFVNIHDEEYDYVLFQAHDLYYELMTGPHTDPSGRELIRRFTADVIRSVQQDGARSPRDLDPGELPDYFLRFPTESEIYADPDFGACFPADLPEDMTLYYSHRLYNQDTDELEGCWDSDTRSLHWRVCACQDPDSLRFTDPEDRKEYDWSVSPDLYISVIDKNAPNQQIGYPLFHIEDVTLELLQRRTAPESRGGGIHINVLKDGMLYEISANGFTPEWVYEQLFS